MYPWILKCFLELVSKELNHLAAILQLLGFRNMQEKLEKFFVNFLVIFLLGSIFKWYK
jgi:hypothetical protein